MRRTAPLLGAHAPRLVALLLSLLGACGSSESAQPATTVSAADGRGGAAGEAPPPSDPARVAAEPAAAPRVPFLWEVRAGERISHLLGTMHVGVALDEALPEAQRAHLVEARAVVVEADPSSLGAQATMQAMMLPPGQSLSTMAGPEVWARLTEALGAQMPTAALERLRPWAASVIFVQHWVGAHLASPPAEGMDLTVIAGARARGQRLLFLEQAQAQLDIIGRIPDAYFLDSLTEVLGDEAEAQRQIGGLVTSYARGDLPAIEALLFDAEDMRASPEYYDLFLYRRNAAWMTALEPLLRQEGGIFVAVGLAHMLGPRGLVESLRARGFTVTRVE